MIFLPAAGWTLRLVTKRPAHRGCHSRRSGGPILLRDPDVYIDFWYFVLFTPSACLGDKAVVMLHEQVGVIILGTIFLFIGVVACCTAAIRGRGAGRILAWFGVFSAMYGVRLFAEVPAAFSLLAGPFWPYAPQLVWIITYVIVIPALLFWAELSLAALRRFLQLMVFPASVIALSGIFDCSTDLPTDSCHTTMY